MTNSVDLDWAQLGFQYVRTPWRFQAEWRAGAWSEGELVDDPLLHIEEGSCALHYGQQCFEGLKAHPGPKGAALVFRPHENARRLARSAERLMMPPPPEELFVRAVRRCVEANREYLPPHESGASLYIRPLLIGVGDNLGLRPATRYIFRVFCSPVGPYFKDGMKGLRLLVSSFDRVAPRGTGAFKVGGNYAPGLLATQMAKDAGYDEALYLDPLGGRNLDEAGSANVFGIRPGADDGLVLVTPDSPSILPSVTMDSLLRLAREELGLTVERRRVPITELSQWREMGCTGTAAVITPIKLVRDDATEYTFAQAPGPVTQELYRLLRGIQRGEIADTREWVLRVE